jgi:hypothetical protein
MSKRPAGPAGAELRPAGCAALLAAGIGAGGWFGLWLWLAPSVLIDKRQTITISDNIAAYSTANSLASDLANRQINMLIVRIFLSAH